ncbi:MAG: tRNA (adenosine(37)-N6)-threonylcarbamoyltransferase complex dimerization subunit type 1 TsaB [bacterium]
MKLLTIDSTLNRLYLSLGDETFFESKIIESDEKKYHSAYIASGVVELLKKHKLEIKNLDAVAVNIGPGSFTGIRVGMTFARVIAQAHNLKAVGVSSLEVLSVLNKSEKPSLVLMDARKGKAYVGIFGKEQLEPCAIELEQALEMAKNGKYFVIADKNMTKLLQEVGFEVLNYEESPENLGKCLFDLAQSKLKSNDDFNWAKLKPLYIQPPPISMPKK